MAGGGGGFIPTNNSETIQRKIEKAREVESQRLDLQVNEFLRGELLQYNDRDTDLTRKRIDDLSGVLGDKIEVETMLFGGSVAKHTYVD